MNKHNGNGHNARTLIAGKGPADYAKAATPAETPTRNVKAPGLDPETVELVKLALSSGATPEAIALSYGGAAGDIARALAPTHAPKAPAAAPKPAEPSADVMAEIARLRAENAALKAKAAPAERGLTFKVSDKGALSVYGMGRFPVTLYREQWERLLAKAEDIRAFIEANAARLKTKGE